MNHRGAQGAFAGIVIGRDVGPLEKREQVLAMALIARFSGITASSTTKYSEDNFPGA